MSQKHVREHDALLAQARTARLLPVEERVLAPVLAHGPAVVHPQSGHGLGDVALVRAGARSVLGVDVVDGDARSTSDGCGEWSRIG